MDHEQFQNLVLEHLTKLSGEVTNLKETVTNIKASMATKDELNDIKASMATKDELNDIRASMATKDELNDIRAFIATKDELNDIKASMAIELNNIKASMATKDELNSIKASMATKDELNGIKQSIIKLENQLTPKVHVLFDGWQQHEDKMACMSEQLTRMESKLDKLDLTITNVVSIQEHHSALLDILATRTTHQEAEIKQLKCAR